MGIRSQVRKKGKIGLKQSLMYIHPFPPTLTPFFNLTFFCSVTKKKLFLGGRNSGGHLPPSSPPNYAYAEKPMFIKVSITSVSLIL
jgi:hypothetical protein